MTRTLIIGGARSGKSAFAEGLAMQSGRTVTCIATARGDDSEMAERIARHRLRRDAQWRTVEEPLALGATIGQSADAGGLVLVDCLTVWLSNLLFSEARDFPEVGSIAPPACFAQQRASLLDAVEHAATDLILVANEVGLGVVPMGAVSRWFVDEAGRLNQALAQRCERVVFVAAGLPMTLKGAPC